MMALCMLTACPQALLAGNPFGGFRLRRRTEIEQLARAIDKVEEDIDNRGSIVVKTPDIWGEARWTQHRAEYEKELTKELENFRFTVNAQISEADGAFLLNAATLSGAIGEGVTDTTNVTNIFTESSFPQGPTASATRADIFDPKSGKEVEGVAIEPVLYLDQLSRYLNHLQQLRRINEGDDNADAPGYALNLMRIPVSLLPGDETRIGYGAEVSISLTPELSDDLLPDTFRDLVINDLADRLSVLLLKSYCLDVTDADIDAIDAIEQELTLIVPLLESRDLYEQIDGWDRLVRLETHGSDARKEVGKRVLDDIRTRVDFDQITNDVVALRQEDRYGDIRMELLKDEELVRRESLAAPYDEWKSYVAKYRRTAKQLQQIETVGKLVAEFGDGVLFDRYDLGSYQSASTRRGRFSIAPSQVTSVLGRRSLASLLVKLKGGLGGSKDCNTDAPHLATIRSFLFDELQSAYLYVCQNCADFLAANAFAIARHVQAVEPESLARIRKSFEGTYHTDTISDELAWMVVVQSAMVNKRLNVDMGRVGRSHSASILGSRHLSFYGCHPDPEAMEAFKEYVKLRWPIHAFSIDPVNQDQNVSDAFARRRETQLALALGFTSGQIGANNFRRFARQLDFDLETISLNRTVVGFSHGNDTFGWRLYPRVQIPRLPSNAEVLFRDLTFGTRNRDVDRDQAQIEPGMRELLAVVVMPSFVPHCRMDIRCNWFELSDPEDKVFTAEESVRIGRKIQEIRLLKARCAQEDCLTRPGDLQRLVRAADQLEKRLPMQDTLIPVPFEKSLSGSELFSEGTRNLGPQLIDYFGEPGINTEGETNLFLVGRNFNLNVTSVIAGGQVADVDLLSREVMRVKIGKGALVKDDVVDVRLSTPYGVSAPLKIPVVKKKTEETKLGFSPSELLVCPATVKCAVTELDVLSGDLKLTGLDTPGGRFEVAFTLEKVLTTPNETPKALALNTGKSVKTTVTADAKKEATIKRAALTNLLASYLKEVKVPVDVKDLHGFNLKAKVKSTIANSKEKDVSGAVKIQLSQQPSCTTTTATATSSTPKTIARAFQQAERSSVSWSQVPVAHAIVTRDRLQATIAAVETGSESFQLLDGESNGVEGRVAFLAQVIAGGKNVAQMTVGPYRVADGSGIASQDGQSELRPLSVGTILETRFDNGRTLASELADALAAPESSKAERVELLGFVKLDGKTVRIDQPVTLYLHDSAVNVARPKELSQLKRVSWQVKQTQ